MVEKIATVDGNEVDACDCLLGRLISVVGVNEVTRAMMISMGKIVIEFSLDAADDEEEMARRKETIALEIAKLCLNGKALAHWCGLDRYDHAEDLVEEAATMAVEHAGRIRAASSN